MWDWEPQCLLKYFSCYNRSPLTQLDLSAERSFYPCNLNERNKQRNRFSEAGSTFKKGFNFLQYLSYVTAFLADIYIHIIFFFLTEIGKTIPKEMWKWVFISDTEDSEGQNYFIHMNLTLQWTQQLLHKFVQAS